MAGSAVRSPSHCLFYPHLCLISQKTTSPFITHIPPICYMSHPSSSSLQSLFNAALQQYADQTGTKIDSDPIVQQLEACDSLDSISSVLQEHAQRFAKSRRDDGRIMKCLKPTIHVLYMLSTSTVLGEGTALVCPTSLILILCHSCLPKSFFQQQRLCLLHLQSCLAYVRFYIYVHLSL
jgi:hypothetical protein